MTTPPPTRNDYPPVLLTSSIQAENYPLSDALDSSPLPAGFKPLITSPSETLLHLDHPHETSYKFTPSFQDRIQHTCTNQNFSTTSGAEALRPEELSLNYSIHSVRPTGYHVLKATPPLPAHFSAHYHVPIEPQQNAQNHFVDTDDAERLAACRTDCITWHSCTETPSYLPPNVMCCFQGTRPHEFHRDAYNGCKKNSHPTFNLHSLNLLEKTASGSPLCHFYSLKPVRPIYQDHISSFAYHHQQKLRTPRDQSPCASDLEFGVIFPHSALHRTQVKTAYYNLSQRYFPYSEMSPRYHDVLNYRLGPPQLNASQVLFEGG